jgi:hypothetical protein
MTFVKTIRQALFWRTVVIGIRITSIGFCNQNERFRLTPNTIEKSENL